VSLAQLGDLLKARWELRQLAASPQSLYGPQLVVCGSARPDQVRVVGICQAIGTRARGRHDRALFEQQDGLARTCKCECVRDRFDSLRVGDGVPSAVEDSELHSFLGCDVRKKVSAVGPRTADLQVRRTRAAERAATEQRPAEVRRTAARARDDPPWRALERRQARAEHAGFVEHLQRALVSGNVQLIPRASIEGMP
jgi:hypothetical protein